MHGIRKSHFIWKQVQNKKKGDEHTTHNDEHLVLLGHIYRFGSARKGINNYEYSDDDVQQCEVPTQ
jgi:hypothetical protein